ncbi:MAG: 2-haloacid dehalogenase [Saprospiraceae bacterium]|jgi:2-haloacid dehalogenase
MTQKMKRTTILFDLGGVLIDWNPRYVFKHYFDDSKKMEWFLEKVCDSDWNEEQDAGRPLAEATAMKVAEFPEWETEIRAFYGRWEEMLGESIDGSVDILRSVRDNPNLRLYALTNWSAETFPVAQKRFEFLQWFEGIVMSGEEKTRKPFTDIYQIVIDRFGVNPVETIFIDDNLRNCQAAEAMGFNVIHFISPENTRTKLAEFQVVL